eukprot:scaffold125819_cov22-Tisochrysis_lutea.AAC.1
MPMRPASLRDLDLGEEHSQSTQRDWCALSPPSPTCPPTKPHCSVLVPTQHRPLPLARAPQ